mgnify:CR=1 FL=1
MEGKLRVILIWVLRSICIFKPILEQEKGPDVLSGPFHIHSSSTTPVIPYASSVCCSYDYCFRLLRLPVSIGLILRPITSSKKRRFPPLLVSHGLHFMVCTE